MENIKWGDRRNMQTRREFANSGFGQGFRPRFSCHEKMVVFGPNFVDFRTVIFIKSFGFYLHVADGPFQVLEG